MLILRHKKGQKKTCKVASNKNESADGLCTRWVPGCMWSRPKAESVVTQLCVCVCVCVCVCGEPPLGDHPGRLGEVGDPG